VIVELTGLQPGEYPLLIIYRDLPGSDEQFYDVYKFMPAYPIGQDGKFSHREGGLEPLPGITSNFWVVQVIHMRGVACTGVSLPLTETETK
jgi:hypothetical protein